MNNLVYGLERTLPLAEGDEIVASVMEHHSVLVPLQELARQRKLALKTIPLTEKFKLDYAAAKNLIGPRTKIVAVTFVSNVLGCLNDVATLSTLAHKAGAVMIVDAAQAAGHMPVSFEATGADYLFFSGHKMCGPTGIGVLVGRDSELRKLAPGSFGGGMIETVEKERASYTEPPTRFEAGTQNIAGAIGLGKAVEYLERIGLSNIASHSRDLALYAIEKLSATEGVHVLSASDSGNAGLVSFAVSGAHAHDVAEILGRENIAVRAGHLCAAPLVAALGVPAVARASFYLYNDKSDIDRLAEGVKKARKIFI